MLCTLQMASISSQSHLVTQLLQPELSPGECTLCVLLSYILYYLLSVWRPEDSTSLLTCRERKAVSCHKGKEEDRGWKVSYVDYILQEWQEWHRAPAAMLSKGRQFPHSQFTFPRHELLWSFGTMSSRVSRCDAIVMKALSLWKSPILGLG